MRYTYSFCARPFDVLLPVHRPLYIYVYPLDVFIIHARRVYRDQPVFAQPFHIGYRIGYPFFIVYGRATWSWSRFCGLFLFILFEQFLRFFYYYYYFGISPLRPRLIRRRPVRHAGQTRARPFNYTESFSRVNRPSRDELRVTTCLLYTYTRVHRVKCAGRKGKHIHIIFKYI